MLARTVSSNSIGFLCHHRDLLERRLASATSRTSAAIDQHRALRWDRTAAAQAT